MRSVRVNFFIPLLILFLITFLSSYKVIFTTGYHLGVDYRFIDAIKMFPLYLSSWDSYYYLGQPTYGNPMTFGLITAFGVYYTAFYMIFNILFKNIASSAFLLFNYVCPFIGFWYLASYVYRDEKFGPLAALYAALLYQTNFFFLWYLRAGPLGIFYCLFPIILRMWFEMDEEDISRRRKIGLFLLLLVILCFLLSSWAALTVQFFIFIGLYECLKFLIKRNPSIFIKKVFKLCCLGLLTILMNPFIFFTYIFYPYKTYTNKLLASYSLHQMRYTLHTTLIHKVLFLYSDYGYVYFIFALFGAYLFRIHRLALLIPLWFIGIFLAKGISHPFVSLSEFIYSKIPIFHFFRNPNRLMAFVIIVTCLFIGYFLLKAVLPRLKNRCHTIIFNILFFFILVSLNPSLLRGDLGGYISVVHNPPHLKEIENYLNITGEDKRFLYLPELQGMQNYTWVRPHKYFSLIQPFWGHMVPTRPMSNASLFAFDFSNRFLTYAHNIIPSSRLFAKLLAKTTTETIILDKTFRKNTRSYYESQRLKMFLDRNPSLKSVINNSAMTIYKNRESLISLFTYYNGLCYAVAPLSIYEVLSMISISSVDNPIIFWHQNADRTLPIYPDKTLLLFYNKTDLDMLGEKLINFYSIPLSIFTNVDSSFHKTWPFRTGWAPFGLKNTPHEAYEVRPYLQKGIVFVSGATVATSAADTLRVNFEVLSSSKYHCLIRILFFPEGNKLKFYLDNKEVKTLSVKTSKYLGMHWVELPVEYLKKGKHVLFIENTTPSLNSMCPVILDGLVVVDDNVYWKIKRDLSEWKKMTKECYIYSNDFLEIILRVVDIKDMEDNRKIIYLTNYDEKKLNLKEIFKRNKVFDRDGLLIISNTIESKKQLIDYLNSNLPIKVLSYKKITNTHYIIDPPIAWKGVIIFQSTFNSNWHLGDAKPNFIVDGYANGYLFSVKNISGGEKLNLHFIPEKWYKTLILSSVIALCILVGCAIHLL